MGSSNDAMMVIVVLMAIGFVFGFMVGTGCEEARHKYREGTTPKEWCAYEYEEGAIAEECLKKNDHTTCGKRLSSSLNQRLDYEALYLYRSCLEIKSQTPDKDK